jgi:hypothetical protein
MDLVVIDPLTLKVKLPGFPLMTLECKAPHLSLLFDEDPSKYATTYKLKAAYTDAKLNDHAALKRMTKEGIPLNAGNLGQMALRRYTRRGASSVEEVTMRNAVWDLAHGVFLELSLAVESAAKGKI